MPDFLADHGRSCPYKLHPSQALRQVVIDFVGAQILLEIAHRGVAINRREFDAGDFGEVFHVFAGQGLAESRCDARRPLKSTRRRRF